MGRKIFSLFLFLALLSACQSGKTPSPSEKTGGLKVLAVETFLADIAQNVAGDRFMVDSLIPAGLDPHAFEPTPGDMARIAESNVLILNGAGFEAWLQPLLANVGGKRLLIEASAGLQSRSPQAGEAPAIGGQVGEVDPHFWLDPDLAIRYVENIRDGLSQADPAGEQVYAQNAAAYIARLKELDAWTTSQVEQIPPTRRLLVTNHEDFGYFADRYGFKIIGAIIPSVSTEASPSAQELAGLIERIRASGAPAIFLETGANPQLAEQVAREAGVKVVTGLYTHSTTGPDGAAPTYIAMLKYDVQAIVEALK